ncbi:MAG: mechanosensitive ion channel domain-containing protein, partial [Planctomycetota bacterium]
MGQRLRSLLLLVCLLSQPINLAAQLTLPPEGSEQEAADEGTADSIKVADATIGGEVTAELIGEKRSAIDADTKLDDEQRAALREKLDQAATALEQAKSLRAKAKDFDELVASAPERQVEIDNQLESIKDKAAEVDLSKSASQLNAELASVSSDLNEENGRVEFFTAEPARRRSKIAEIPESLAQIDDELSKLKSQLGEVLDPQESNLSTEIERLYSRARFEELTASAASLRSEQAAYTTTGDLLAAERRLAESKSRRLIAYKKLLQEAIAEKQREEAEETANDLRRTLDDVPESLREFATKNIELAESQQALINEEAVTKQETEDIKQARLDVEASLATSKDRVDEVGLTEALGYMLRTKRAEAEKTAVEFRPRSDVRTKIRENQISTFTNEDELRSVKKQIADLEDPGVDWESKDVDWQSLSLDEAKWVLLRNRQQLLEETQQSRDAVLQSLLVSDTQRRELVKSINEFTTYVDQRLFWTRSASVVSISELRSLPAAFQWMVDPDNWSRVWSVMGTTVTSRTARILLVILAVIFLMYFRPRFRDAIVREGEAANKLNVTFRSTAIALLATIADACVWPFVLLVPGFLLAANSGRDPFVGGLSGASFLASLYVAPRELLRQICRPKGLAQSHFGWSDDLRKHLRRHLRWYTSLGGICIFFLAWFHFHPEVSVRLAILRSMSVLLFVVTACFHHVIFGASSPIYAALVRSNPDSKTYRFRKLIWLSGIAICLVFCVMAITGYLETIFRMAKSVQSSFLLLVFVVIIFGVISRWMMLRKRDLARAKVAEMRAKRSDEESMAAVAAKEAGIVVQDEEAFDLKTLDERARQTATVASWCLVIVGGVLIWSDLLPALTFLEEFEWNFGSGDSEVSVSLLDVLCAAISVIVLIYATRVVPGVFDLLVLGQTQLDSGARYAISTLLRYTIIVVGTLTVLNLVSVPYNQLGWLLAAISVGLGFGLQEIVANFVSGIILLLERPVRVGDVVTIGDVTGIVSRIQIR